MYRPACTWMKSVHLSHRLHLHQLEEMGTPEEARAPTAPAGEKDGQMTGQKHIQHYGTNIVPPEPSGPTTGRPKYHNPEDAE